MKADVLIVGSGVSGLYCALKLPRDKKIVLICKGKMRECDSYLAQGGICTLRDNSDFDAFFEDTMRAGHYENNKESVKLMIEGAGAVTNDLISYGVRFNRDESGNLAYTKEGAHSSPRILYHADVTGKEITEKLIEAVLSLDNVKVFEDTTLIDIIEHEGKCVGGVVSSKGGVEPIYAKDTVLATGGVGGLYEHSTNFDLLTGDALAIAIKHKVKLKDISYVQIHPTTLYVKGQKGRSFLISESVRGEGAVLRDKNMNRFVNELLPRDKVSEAIHKQMKIDGTEFVWEDLRTIPEDELRSHFPNIIKRCAEAGYDVFKECIPVVPAQHYFMGGIFVDENSKTSMEHLYAVGETSCNGVHGKNRLASNSLLEALVFASRSASDIAKTGDDVSVFPEIDTGAYDVKELQNEYKKIARTEIDRETIRKKGDRRMFDEVTLKLQVDPLILSALREDITSEDVSTNSVMPSCVKGEVDLICKEDGVLCGMQVFTRVFTLLDANTEFEIFANDGDEIKKGQLLAKVRGDIRVLLSGERTALNYMQRMSGIATYTRSVASLLAGTKTKLLDTRKTSPNNRIFEKYAVRVGGGTNHRYNLTDGVLLKDNHIGAAGSVRNAVLMAKEYAPFVRKIEIEVENYDMVVEAVEAGADIIMLDNMSHDEMKRSIEFINGRAEVEVSGNVTKENISRLTDLGVDFVSSGALTHSAPILDLSLKNLHAI